MKTTRRQFVRTLLTGLVTLPLVGKLLADSDPTPKSNSVPFTFHRNGPHIEVIPSKELAAKYGLRLTDTPVYLSGDSPVCVRSRRLPQVFAESGINPSESMIKTSLEYAQFIFGWKTVFAIVVIPQMDNNLVLSTCRVVVRGAKV